MDTLATYVAHNHPIRVHGRTQPQSALAFTCSRRVILSATYFNLEIFLFSSWLLGEGVLPRPVDSSLTCNLRVEEAKQGPRLRFTSQNNLLFIRQRGTKKEMATPS